MIDYLSYWSLLRKPFAGDDEHPFFTGVPQREAIAGLNYFVSHGIQSAFLIAANRSGTSALLSYAKRMRGFGDCAAEMILTDGMQTSCDAAQAELCHALGYTRRTVVQDPHNGVSLQIHEALKSTARQGVRTIWLIDQCRQPAARVARDLVNRHPEFSCVIATSGEQFGMLAAELGRCGMRIDLAPLSIADTIEYLRHGVQHAGSDRQLFPDNTAVRLNEISRGALADLAHVAESALALAASHQMQEVTPAIIEAVDEQVRRAA